jgi:hypothetical protein
MQEKYKLSSDGGDSGSKKCRRGHDGAYGGIWRSLETDDRFCVGAFGRNLASVAVEMFSHFIYFVNKSYEVCAFNAICKDIAAINCITVQHKNR